MKTQQTKKSGPTRLITDRPTLEPSRDEIAVLARAIWEQKGRASGQDVENWLHAEAQLRQARNQHGLRA